MPNSNQYLRLKGQEIENGVIALYRALDAKIEQTYHDNIDATIEGIPVEIKSAELLIKNGHNWKSTGYFIVKEEYHKELVAIGGMYHLVLTFKGKPLIHKVISAEKVHIQHKRILLRTLYKDEAVTPEEFIFLLKKDSEV